MKSILAISASPSAKSKTSALCDLVLARFKNVPSITTEHLRLKDVDAAALLAAQVMSPTVAAAMQAVEDADGVVLATPIFKASYSGMLKAFLDVLPQFALTGKVVLPLATGGTVAHVLALDYALRPVLQSMGARHIVQSFFLHEGQISFKNDKFEIAADAEAMLREAVHHFKCSLLAPVSDVMLGHPRPDRLAPPVPV